MIGKDKKIFRIAKELNYQKKKIYPTIDNVAILEWGDEEELENEYYQKLSEEMIRQAEARNMQVRIRKKTVYRRCQRKLSY